MTLWPNGTRTKPRVSSKYGPRTGGAYSFHYGTDFTGYTDVKAVLGGTVTLAGYWNSAAGYTVAVDYRLPDGRLVTVVNMHLAAGSITVRKEHLAAPQALPPGLNPSAVTDPLLTAVISAVLGTETP